MNDLATQLHALGLDATAASLDDLLARAIERRLAPRELLEEIVRSEAAHRSRRSLERRRVKSRLGAFKPIADQAVLAGYSVLFRTATELLDDIQCDSPERRRQRIAAYTRAHLLCIDEVGKISCSPEQARGEFVDCRRTETFRNRWPRPPCPADGLSLACAALCVPAKRGSRCATHPERN